MNQLVYGLIGRTLGHSWSVPIHRAFGCDAYELIELEPDELAGFLARPDIGGLNVTIPYKLDVMSMCDVIADEARAIGSVNTVVRRPDGTLAAYNTDIDGFRYMVARSGISLAGRKVLVLGSGGASRTCVYGACEMGASSVTVISRSGPDNYGNLDRHADAEIIINATPVGMYPNVGVAPVDLSVFPDCCGVIDCIYNPLRPALLLDARQRGIPCTNGLPMLVAQAKAAEEHFFGVPIDDSCCEGVLRELGCRMASIVLIGMPGCGKTAVGKCIARQTGRELIDIDARVVDRAGCTIDELFAREGEAAFRHLEHEEVVRAGARGAVVISCGGGVVLDEANYAPLRQNGRIYQIIRDTGLLATNGRPLSRNVDLDGMQRVRGPLYRRFRDVEILNDTTIAQAACSILADFNENAMD